MTKEEFLGKMDALLQEYCVGNPDYQNLHEAKVIVRTSTAETEEAVRVMIDTYLFAKQNKPVLKYK